MFRPHVALAACGVVVAGWFFAGCGDDASTDPPGVGDDRVLVGGGRHASDDPETGGPGDSGPVHPDFDPPSGAYLPVFYADQDCQADPSVRVIRNPEEWQSWWTAATECLRGTDGGGPGDDGDPNGGGGPDGDDDPSDDGRGDPDDPNGDPGHPNGDPDDPDGGSGDPTDPDDPTEPGEPWDPYPDIAPDVDFSQNVVVVIALEAAEALGRSVWIEEVVGDVSGTTVRYTVSEFGPDCLPLIFGQFPEGPTSPTVAMVVPGPLAEPINAEREDVVYDCSWEPDPNEPLALYYTDAACDLGSGEMIFTDATAFEAWARTAIACDEVRWYDTDGNGIPGDEHGDGDWSPGGPGGDPTVPPDVWMGMEVDFSTHAVLILRSDASDRWGGGVWLSGLEPGAGGTTIDYVTMVPGEDCPLVEGGTVQPTVAIRVPLPLPEPIVWARHVETIGCRWEEGGGNGEPDDDGTWGEEPDGIGVGR